MLLEGVTKGFQKIWACAGASRDGPVIWLLLCDLVGGSGQVASPEGNFPARTFSTMHATTSSLKTKIIADFACLARLH